MPENVQMSMFGADFLRHSEKLLYVDGAEMAEINFRPHGYLMLASDAGTEAMEMNHQVQM